MDGTCVWEDITNTNSFVVNRKHTKAVLTNIFVFIGKSVWLSYFQILPIRTETPDFQSYFDTLRIRFQKKISKRWIICTSVFNIKSFILKERHLTHVIVVIHFFQFSDQPKVYRTLISFSASAALQCISIMQLRGI